MMKSGELKIIAGAALFALIPVGVKSAEGHGIYTILSGRLLIACLVLFIFSSNRNSFLKIKPGTLGLLTLWSMMMLGAMLCYFYAIRTSGAAVSSSLLGTQPVIILLLSAIFLKEKISYRSIACALLSLAGILLICQPAQLFTGAAMGKVMAMSSALLLSLIFIFQKKYLNEEAPERLVFYQCLLQLPVLFFLMKGENIHLNSSLLLSSLILGVLCTALSYFLIYAGAKTVAIQKIGILQSIEYVLPVFIGLLFYKEKLSSEALLGCILITTSCILVQIRSRLNKQALVS